jgi:curved DNA-binding protein CbpA
MRLGNDVLEADLYGELGVLPDATESEIRVAYRRQVRTSHPDLNQDNPEAVPRMKRLNVAARVLLDPSLRRSYDRAPRRRTPETSERPSARPPRQQRAWFEQRELSFDDDWAPPAPPERPVPGSRFAEFFQELRGRDGHFSLQVQAAIDSMTPRQQVSLAAALCGLALALIFWAHPQSLMGDGTQPTEIDPSALNP